MTTFQWLFCVLSAAVFGFVNPANVTSIVGSTVFLQCPLAIPDNNGCSWSHRHTFLDKRDNSTTKDFGRFKIQVGSLPPYSGCGISGCILSIQNATLDDEGSWTCILNDNRRQVVELLITDYPRPALFYQGVELTDPSATTTISNEMPTAIECVSFGGWPKPDEIVWRATGRETIHDNSLTPPSSNLDEPITARSTYDINRSPDPIDVTCVVKQANYEKEVTWKFLTEHGPTKIAVVHPDNDLYIGPTQPRIRLSCEANGFPKPDNFVFRWMESKEVAYYEKGEEVGRGKHVTVDRPGWYQCAALVPNIYPSYTSDRIQLVETSANNITLMLGMQVTLPCPRYAAGDCPCTWMHAHVIVHSDSSEINSPFHIASTADHCDLTISVVDLAHGGLWQCFVPHSHRAVVFWIDVTETHLDHWLAYDNKLINDTLYTAVSLNPEGQAKLDCWVNGDLDNHVSELIMWKVNGEVIDPSPAVREIKTENFTRYQSTLVFPMNIPVENAVDPQMKTVSCIVKYTQSSNDGSKLTDAILTTIVGVKKMVSRVEVSIDGPPLLSTSRRYINATCKSNAFPPVQMQLTSDADTRFHIIYDVRDGEATIVNPGYYTCVTTLANNTNLKSYNRIEISEDRDGVDRIVLDNPVALLKCPRLNGQQMSDPCASVSWWHRKFYGNYGEIVYSRYAQPTPDQSAGSCDLRLTKLTRDRIGVWKCVPPEVTGIKWWNLEFSDEYYNSAK